MQMKLVLKRYLVIRYSYTIKNGKKEIVVPFVSKNGEWEKIDLFEDYLITYIDYCMAHSGMNLRIKEKAIDLVKCFEWLLCIILAILFIVYLIR